MSAPLIDAETLREFLDKAEPLMPQDYLRRVELALERRPRRAALQTLPWQSLWQEAPATRRLPAEERARWQGAAQAAFAAVLREDAGAVLSAVEEAPQWLRDWATFWLHGSDPEAHPWWARWVYQPGDRTGALLLVLDDAGALQGLGAAECYGAMAEANRFLAEVIGSTRRLPGIAREHAATVALAAVYGVYMFTMASWRMTTEFTQALPPFPTVVRALLGIDRREWSQVGAQGQTG